MPSNNCCFPHSPLFLWSLEKQWIHVSLLIIIYHPESSPECLHLIVVGGLARLNDLTGYAGRDYMFLVGPPKLDRLLREKPD